MSFPFIYIYIYISEGIEWEAPGSGSDDVSGTIGMTANMKEREREMGLAWVSEVHKEERETFLLREQTARNGGIIVC